MPRLESSQNGASRRCPSVPLITTPSLPFPPLPPPLSSATPPSPTHSPRPPSASRFTRHSPSASTLPHAPCPSAPREGTQRNKHANYRFEALYLAAAGCVRQEDAVAAANTRPAADRRVNARKNGGVIYSMTQILRAVKCQFRCQGEAASVPGWRGCWRCEH